MSKVQIRTFEGMRAVVLPSDMELEGNEVYAYRDSVTGDVVLSSRPLSWESYFRLCSGGEVPQDFMTEVDRFGAPPPESDIERLASAWQQVAGRASFPAECDGRATPDALRAADSLIFMLREYLETTDDRRLSGLMYLIEQAVLHMG